MQSKNLGDSEIQVPPLVFGGNVFGWTLDEQTSESILNEAFERGFYAIDTADAYSRWVEGNSGGESETIIGRWMADRGCRDAITLITKVGYDMGQGHHDLSRQHILKGCEDSLRRLQTDRIDLYFSHLDDEQTSIEETLGAYEELVQSGKVRVIGASNLSVQRIEASLNKSEQLGIAAYQVIQPEYNLYDHRQFENEYAPLARKHNLGVITYFSLASGFLTGKYHSKDDLPGQQRGDRVEKYFEDDRGLAIVDALEHVASEHSVQPAAVALAWIMANPDVTAPIVSATRESHLTAFEQAISLELSDADMETLDCEQL